MSSSSRDPTAQLHKEQVCALKTGGGKTNPQVNSSFHLPSRALGELSMEANDQTQEPQHTCHGESEIGHFTAAQIESQPKVYRVSDHEFVVEYQGELTRYRDGEVVPNDGLPKG
jgi:hypothetical protein